MFNNVKRGTSITRIVPSQIVLDIDRMVTQQLPVQLHLDGKPAAGYKVVSTEVRPAQIAATGPSRFITNQKHLNTEPLGIQDAANDIDAPVRVLDPGPHVKLAANVVEAKVILQPMTAQREFRGVKVRVHDAASRTRIEPAEANVIVRGPAPKLSKLDLSDSVFVDASGLLPGGWHVKPVQVKLPDGMQLVRQEPQKVRLRVYR
jgi:YbbR domain-containing protein